MPHYSVDLSEDVEELIPLYLNFKNASPYKDYPHDLSYVRATFEQAFCFTLKADDEVVGFLVAAAGSIHPLLGPFNVASELAWWVEPEHRGHGKKLLEAFLLWAEEFDYVTMSALDDSLDKLYSSYGFTKNEVAYIKRK